MFSCSSVVVFLLAVVVVVVVVFVFVFVVELWLLFVGYSLPKPNDVLLRWMHMHLL